MNSRKVLTGWLVPAALAMAATAQANVVYTVNLNTAAISGAAGYDIAFSFQDGEGIGDNNNSATLSNFNFGGGSAAGAPVLSGDATGDIATSVTLTDSVFSSLLIEGFTPGNSLSFKLDLTTNVDAGGTPDFFGFSILSGGVSLPTLDDTGGDNLLYFNIDSANPTPAAWATARASQVALAAPVVTTSGGQLPVPDTAALLGLGLATLWVIRRRAQA